MNVRVKFRKYGNLKFIGHLDVMRYFQKAMRRAEIPVCYSEGFSPHMIMSFASPLGVGLTSNGEYMDVRVEESPSSAEAVSRLNAVMVEGIEVLSWRALPDKAGNAMASVAAADYDVRFREGYAPEDGWQDRFRIFMGRSSVTVIKEGKKGSRELDIRPLIYDWNMCGDAIFLQVSAGSASNLKPELLMKAFSESEGMELSPFSLMIHRRELYADQGTEEKRRLIPLEMLGEEIGRA